MSDKQVIQRITSDGSIVTIEYPTIGKRHVIDTSKFGPEVQESARMHGYEQKYGDAKSGKSPQEKYDMVARIREAHEAGSWNITDRAGRDDSAIIIEAIARLTSKKAEAISKPLEKLDEAKRKAWLNEKRAHPKVIAMIQRIRAERAEEAAANAEEFKLN